MALKIVLLAGDGVGPEVMREGVKVLKAVESAYGVSFDLVPFPCGGQHYLDTGEEWPDGAFESWKAAERVIRFAFELAKQRQGAPSDGKHRVTCVDKSNVTAGCKLFRQVYDEVATRYPTVLKDYAYIDAFQQWLIRSPEVYDVAVTSNVFGDIATDLAAVLQGGMGMAAGGNIGDAHAMFEPIHGRAPKHAGKDEVNPTAMILAVQMMLDWLGRREGDKALREGATALEQTGEATMKKGTILPYDLRGTAKCSEVGTAVASAIARPRKMS